MSERRTREQMAGTDVKISLKTTLIMVLAAAFLLLGVQSASAQEADTYGETPDQVLDDSDKNDDGDVGDDEVEGQNDETAVLGSQTDSGVRVAGQSLALTGGDVLGLTVIGGALLLAGTALVLRSRRQHT